MPSLHAALAVLFCLEGAALGILALTRSGLLDREIVLHGGAGVAAVMGLSAIAVLPEGASLGWAVAIAVGALLHAPYAVLAVRRIASPAAAPASPPPAPGRRGSGYERSLAAEKRGEWERALEGYRALLAGGPEDVELLQRIGEIEVRRRRPAEASAAFRQALSLARTPRHRLDLLFRVTDVEVEDGRRTRAIEYLEDFVRLEPDEKLRRLAASRLESLTVGSGERRVVSVPEAGGDLDRAGQPFGRYRLLGEVGRGGMGVVWKAWDPVERRVVAAKILLEEAHRKERAVERFLREVRAASLLEHPNIVRVHEVGVQEGAHYFTSDFVEGRPLSALVEEGAPLRERVRIVRKIADALQHAHERGILHRDVKPENVLVDAAGEPHVLDFGLAKEIESASGLTQSGVILGTPQYMSPEQARGLMKELGPASDQFSLGVVFYELLTGRKPFHGESLYLLLHAIIGTAPLPPRQLDPSIPVELERICLRALEKDPAHRFSSMGEFSAELAVILGG